MTQWKLDMPGQQQTLLCCKVGTGTQEDSVQGLLAVAGV